MNDFHIEKEMRGREGEGRRIKEKYVTRKSGDLKVQGVYVKST